MALTPAQVTRARLEDWKARHWFDFRFVQRLEPGTRWFGSQFDLEDMAMAEFENGTSDESLARIYTSILVKVHSEVVTCGDTSRSVYFVGSQGAMSAKMDAFEQWLNNGFRSHAYTGFAEAFAGIAPEWHRTVAWWSFDADVLWTLDKTVAEQLLHGILHPAK